MDRVLLRYAIKSGVVASLTWQHQITQCVLVLLFAALTWNAKK